jgi:hypothetical protein
MTIPFAIARVTITESGQRGWVTPPVQLSVLLCAPTVNLATPSS